MKWLKPILLLEIILFASVNKGAAAESVQVSAPAVAQSQSANSPMSQEASTGNVSVGMPFGQTTITETEAGLSVGLNFTSSTLFLDSSFIPPDTMGNVGLHHIVELINGRYSVRRKSDAALIKSSSLDQFWRDAGVSFTGFTFDPRIVYDPFSERWFASSVDNSSGDNHFLLAVSKSADPTAGWLGFAIDSDSTDQRWADYPTLGFNKDGMYLAANMFPIPGRGAGGILPVTIVAIPKDDLLGPTPTVVRATKFENVSSSIIGIGVQPVVDLDNQGQPAALLSNFQTASGLLKRADILGDIISPTLDTSGGLISVQPFSSISSAEQPGPKQNLEIANGTIFHGNIVKQNGAMWGVQTVNRQGRGALRWFQIDADTNILLQEGLIADSQLNFYYGSIAVNKFDDVVIGFSGSSESQFVSSYAALGNTVLGTTTFGEPVQLKAGVAAYFQDFGTGRNRWGDYSATVIDPADPFTFWTFQEFVSSEDRWSTQITQLLLPPPEVLNNFVAFIPNQSSFETTSDRSACPAGFVGKFNFDARLANDGNSSLSHLMVRATELTNGNLLQNADYGPRGVGAALTVAKSGDFADHVLSPREVVDVPFSICLKDTKPFNFFVDVLGIKADLSDSVVSR